MTGAEGFYHVDDDKDRNDGAENDNEGVSLGFELPEIIQEKKGDSENNGTNESVVFS